MDEYLTDYQQQPISNTPITLDSGNISAQPKPFASFISGLRILTIIILLTTFLPQGLSYYSMWTNNQLTLHVETPAKVQIHGFETISDDQGMISLRIPTGYEDVEIISPTQEKGISLNATYDSWSLQVIGIPGTTNSTFEELKKELLRPLDMKQNYSQTVVNFVIDGQTGAYSKEVDDLMSTRTFVVTHNGWYYSFNFNYSDDTDFEAHEETVKQIMSSVDFLK